MLQCDRSATVRMHVMAVPRGGSRERWGGNMWWAIGIGGIVYLILVFTLGWSTLWNGHRWMFFFGIFFPVLWIFGAFMRPPELGQPV